MDKIKPFLKWAGGKTGLLPEIRKYYPFSDQINTYIEPFVGSGAVLFDILTSCKLNKIFINDINYNLILCYRSVKDEIDKLIQYLKSYQNEYLSLDEQNRKIYYKSKRDIYNSQQTDPVELAALFIFLNKTCFNGLYRVNMQGKFNVPMGKYKNPAIFDENNLRLISEKLQNVTITNLDYKKLLGVINDRCFIYFDPPYLPLSKTSNFTSYTNNKFNTDNQKELADFVNEIHKRGSKFLLSNSDPKNIDENNTFFDELYKKYHIHRISAKRTINCKADNRGNISELLITNIKA